MFFLMQNLDLSLYMCMGHECRKGTTRWKEEILGGGITEFMFLWHKSIGEDCREEEEEHCMEGGRSLTLNAEKEGGSTAWREEGSTV